MDNEGVRTYAISALGFVTGLTVSDFSTILQILSFVISCIAGIYSIWLHQRQIKSIREKKRDEAPGQEPKQEKK